MVQNITWPTKFQGDDPEWTVRVEGLEVWVGVPSQKDCDFLYQFRRIIYIYTYIKYNIYIYNILYLYILYIICYIYVMPIMILYH